MDRISTASLNDKLLQCNRCGFCQEVCPTYAATRNEFDVARGRIRMMRMMQEGRRDPGENPDVSDQVDQCLLCGACVANCPSGVPTDGIMQAAREDLLKKKGFSLFHSLLYRGVLTRRERLEKVSALVRLLDKTHIRNQVAKTAATRAFSFIDHALSYLPAEFELPARGRLSVRNSQRGSATVGYFLGCGTDVFTPGVATASVDCLEKMGFSVFIPRVCCCGGPHFSAGDIRRARSLARENIAVLMDADLDFIVTDCATCAHTLVGYASFFPQNDPIQERIVHLTEKIKDISTFMYDWLCAHPRLPAPVPGGEEITVTWHDPCHAVRGLGGGESPRKLIQSIPGIYLVEMDLADSCCGGAGSYTFRHPDMSRKILDRKVDAVVRTGAAIVVTSCPSCILQLSAGLRRRHLNIRVMHVMELQVCSPWPML